MGLFGKKEDPEDLMYQAMTFLEKISQRQLFHYSKKLQKLIQKM